MHPTAPSSSLPALCPTNPTHSWPAGGKHNTQNRSWRSVTCLMGWYGQSCSLGVHRCSGHFSQCKGGLFPWPLHSLFAIDIWGRVRLYHLRKTHWYTISEFQICLHTCWVVKCEGARWNRNSTVKVWDMFSLKILESIICFNFHVKILKHATDTPLPQLYSGAHILLIKIVQWVEMGDIFHYCLYGSTGDAVPQALYATVKSGGVL